MDFYNALFYKQEQNDGVGNPLITAAAFLTPTTITCVLPANGETL